MATGLEAGSSAPDFQLETDSQGTVSLKDYAGAPLVLYFYPKDDTSGCTKQAIAFTEHADDFSALGAKVLGVSPDSVAKHGKFRAKHELGIALGSDEDKTTLEAYGVWVEKSMYGRKYMGVERSTFLIDGQGQIARIWRKVKVPGHVEDVLEAVKAL
jgi:peroxiredoxin Q/BCP